MDKSAEMGDEENFGDGHVAGEQRTVESDENSLGSVNLEEQEATKRSDEVFCMQRMLDLMMVENRRRDELMLNIVERLTPTTGDRQSRTSGEEGGFHVMPDLTKVIGFFDGDKDADMVNSWINNIETSARLNHWPDTYTLETARAHLKGPAAFWYRTKAEVIETWQNFKDELLKTYGHAEKLTDKWEKMKVRRQGRGESILSYYYEKVELCQKLKLSIEDAKEEILGGLLSHDVAANLVTKQHKDYDELLHDILAVDKVKNGKIGEKVNFTARKENKELNKSQNETKKKEWGRQDTEERKCFKCGKLGHISTQCVKEKPVCYRCQEEGHVSYQCRQKSTVVKQSKVEPQQMKSSVRVIYSGNDAGDKLIQQVVVNDKIKLVGFVDPGSSCSTLRKDVAELHNFEVLEDRQPIYGFSKDKNAAVYTLGKVLLKLAINNVEAKNVELLVVPNDVQDTDLIVGRTYTELDHIAYMRKGDTFLFGYADEQPFKDIDVNIFTEGTYKIAADSVIEKKGAKDVQILKETSRNIVLKMYNASEGKIELKAGETFKFEPKINEEKVNCLENQERDISMDMINADKQVSHEKRMELLELLNNYRDCFALKLEELGCTNVTTMEIEDNGVPVRCQPYKTSADDRRIIATIVDELKRCGLVAETNSPYASPVLLVRKKNGDPRMVVDYRRLNNQTRKMNYPVSDIDEQFKYLAGCKIFATLDLANGYMQVPLGEKSREKTAFITPDTTGEFTRMIFGLTNAPYEFVRMMNLVLGPLRNKICCCYLDDVIIPAKDWSQLLERIKLVLEAFRRANLTLNLRKCEFGKKQVTYLGFTVSEEGLGPGTRKIEAIDRFPKPRNVHEVRRFLGLTGFFRRFVKNYAVMTRSLTDLTKKGCKFEFTEECEKAFQNLKVKLMEAPILKLYSANASTELHTDASAVGIAGVLLQRDEQNKLRMVYCVSKKTTEAEGMYHSTRLELLAIVWCVERLRGFLLGLKFKIVTDCQAVTYLNVKKNVHPQIARWFSILQEYDFTIEHRRGERMTHADALSRAPTEESNDTEDYIFERRLNVLQTFTEEQQISMIQWRDEKLKRIIDILRKTEKMRSKEEKEVVQKYELDRNRLYRVREANGEKKKLYVIPDSMRKGIVVKNHDMVGHFSAERTTERILEKYWFPGVRRYVKRHIAGCFECLANKIPGGKKMGLLHPIPPTKRPFERIHVDNVGPFLKSSRGFEHITVIIDSFTRFVLLYPIKSTKATAMMRALEDVFHRYGIPRMIVSDRGTCFTAGAFRKFCETRGIQHVLNSPRHPQANGMVERVNRTLIPAIQAEMASERQWDRCLKKVQFVLNSAVNKTTRRTPFNMLYGYNPSLEHAEFQKVAALRWEDPDEIRRRAHEDINKNQAKYKHHFDKKRYDGVHYDVGEIVVVKGAAVATGETTKLQQKYKGPYLVVKVLPSDTYLISRLDVDDSKKRHTTTTHVSQLKGYYNHEVSEDEERTGEKTEDEDEDSTGEKSQDEDDVETEKTEDGERTKQKTEDEEETRGRNEAPIKKERRRRARRMPRKFQDYEV